MKKVFFGQRRSHQLEADRETIAQSARDADAADARQIGGNGENVGEVGLERRVGKSAQLPRGRWRDRRGDEIDLGKSLGKIASDQLADFLCFDVKGVVVPAAEDVSAEDDAAFHFRTESFGSGAIVQIRQISGLGGTVAVAHAIKAGEVG